MLVLFLLFTVLFVFQSISSVGGISPVVVQSAIDTSNNTNSTANKEQREIRIFQQGMFNLDRTLTPTVTAQDYVLSLDIYGNYTFDNASKIMSIDNRSFSGTLFGIENLAAMHKPQIQMNLDNIQNFIVSLDLKTINYHASFVDVNSNLIANVKGALQFKNPIAFDKAIDRQDAISDSSIIKITLGTSTLNPILNSPGMKINQISIS